MRAYCEEKVNNELCLDLFVCLWYFKYIYPILIILDIFYSV